MLAMGICAVLLLLYSAGRTYCLTIPADAEWNLGLHRGCPKYPAEQTDCSENNKGCYDHGDKTYRPCWTICPPPDEDPASQRCTAWCGDYYQKYCKKLKDIPTTTDSDEAQNQDWPFGTKVVVAVLIAAVILVVTFVVLWKLKCCDERTITNTETTDPLLRNGGAEAPGNTQQAAMDFGRAQFHGPVTITQHNNAAAGSASSLAGPNGSSDAAAARPSNGGNQQPPGEPDGRPDVAEGGGYGGDAPDDAPGHRMGDMDTPTAQLRPVPEAGDSIQASDQSLPQQASTG